jgi:beta-aspartyl-dipeptidase (metallo-type)
MARPEASQLGVALRGARVYAPDEVGVATVVIAGTRIAARVPGSASFGGGLVEEISLDGLILTPGLVDGHVHYLGGGGGDGFDSRSPELQPSDFVAHGITTAVAPLGIDPVSRSLEGLLAKARALRQAGLSAFIYTGGFRKPLLNLSGTPWRDVYLVPDVLGVKLTFGVEQAPEHSLAELEDLGRELLWVEQATGRRAVIHAHLGPLPSGHELVERLAQVLPEPSRLVVTHCNRTLRNLETAARLLSLGAWADMTCMMSPERGYPSSIPAADAVLRLRDSGQSLDRVSLSTDGNGTVPERRPDGTWDPYRIHLDSLLDEIRRLVTAGLDVGEAIGLATEHPATALGLQRKGRIAPGCDADLLGFDEHLVLREVYAMGRRLLSDGQVTAPGRYEAREP